MQTESLIPHTKLAWCSRARLAVLEKMQLVERRGVLVSRERLHHHLAPLRSENLIGQSSFRRHATDPVQVLWLTTHLRTSVALRNFSSSRTGRSIRHRTSMAESPSTLSSKPASAEEEDYMNMTIHEPKHPPQKETYTQRRMRKKREVSPSCLFSQFNDL